MVIDLQSSYDYVQLNKPVGMVPLSTSEMRGFESHSYFKKFALCRKACRFLITKEHGNMRQGKVVKIKES